MAWAVAPGVPAASIAAPGNTQITVTFMAPGSDGGSTITAYSATCTSSDGGATRSAANSGTVSPIIIAGLSNGKSYTCTVDATNADGTSAESAPSAAVTPAAVPDAPSITSAVVTNTQVAVTFSAGADNGSPVTLFTVTCTGGMSPISMTGPSSPVTIAGLARGTTFTCVVTATNGIGTGPASSAAVVVIPAQVPDAPGQPTVARGNAMLAVAFSTPASNGSPITSYVVVCTGGFVPVAVTGPGSPTMVTGLDNGTTYSCTVTANNAIGSGPPSAASIGVPSTVPNAPAQPTVVREIGKIAVYFSEPANNGATISSYSAVCTAAHGARGERSGSGSPITVAGLTNGRTYICVVAATNVAGTGPASIPSASAIPGTAPAAPGIMSVVSGRAPGPVGPLIVGFKARSNNGTPITAYRATCDPVTPGAAPGVNTSTGTPITVPGLITGKAYTCYVVAISASGTSGRSPTMTTIVGTPGQPKILSITARAHGLTLTFVTPANNGLPILHEHAVCTSSNGAETASRFARNSPFPVIGLTPGGRYTCTLTAINLRGEGPPATAAGPVTVPY